MSIYYHGSSVLFDKFDLSHATEGDGKVKFGYGVYVTSKYESAAHYSGEGRGKEAEHHYVYTVEVPDITDDNFFNIKGPVNPAIIAKTETKLGQELPQEVKSEGKYFRKYLGNVLVGTKGSVKKLMDKADVVAEKAAAEFLVGIGVELIAWPTSWTNPDKGLNLAVMDDSKVRITAIDKITLAKGKLVEGSQKKIR